MLGREARKPTLRNRTLHQQSAAAILGIKGTREESPPPPGMAEARPLADPRAGIREKIRTLVSIAASNDSSISTAELFLLLPSGAFSGADELDSFVCHDPTLHGDLIVIGGEIAFRGSEELARRRMDQIRLSAGRLELARSFSDQLVKLCPWIRLAAISGSTAYAATKKRDDLDFFIVARRNRLWITLVVAMLTAKIGRTRNRDLPVFCFNRILEEGECARVFGSPRDPLFAREALNLRILGGSNYYREVLISASWIDHLFPALFRQIVNSIDAPDAITSNENGRFWSILNWAALAALAPYLTFAGLWRNNRLRRAGNFDAQFRTIIRRGFFAYESTKYDLLRETYRRAF